MLKIIVPGAEHYDEVKREFVTIGDEVLELEHSLVSLSKWESEFEIPFISKDSKTPEQMLAYIKYMTLGDERPDELYDRLTADNISAINTYLDRKMTATWFSEHAKGGKGSKTGEVITAELIYYWMVSWQIPFECQHWHLRKLLTLIEVCSVKNQPQKKMPKREQMSQQAALNQARKAQMGTTG